MTRIAGLRRRLDAITVTFSGTLAAKLIKLTVDQRRQYDEWRDRMAVFYASYPDGEAYGQMINGDGPSPLPRDVRLALFGATIGIPTGATEAQAGEIYRRVALGD
ncbi:hypothetical protein HMP09_2325 [Sphingomonas sp. HMP9]|uniref:hypothetical protein n=1 Tax=Sphingomonas sp. HMP9 TaxID=1517554 RepID=UPI0015969831|nr:hypothetical protein [Sphingomonas sp. HMP9]BCA63091.1 hypothetical protein HMP09_2325 [Sphingomonas sp. HMP9]